MCLEVSVALSPLAKAGVGPERLATTSGLHVAKGKNNLGTCLQFSRDGSCSCDPLANDAAFDGPTWLLDDDAAQRLAQAVQLLGKDAKSFTFQSRWLGDRIMPPQRIKLSELLAAIRSNSVPKNTPLIVGSHP
jgi:hypothetical protein